MWQKKEEERIKERKERGEGEWWRAGGDGKRDRGLKENAVKGKEREKERRKKGDGGV